MPYEKTIRFKKGKVKSLVVPLMPIDFKSGLRILSDPSDAYIILGGKTQEQKTPILMSLKPGIYPLLIRRQGFNDYKKTIIITSKRATSVDVKLHRKGN